MTPDKPAGVRTPPPPPIASELRLIISQNWPRYGMLMRESYKHTCIKSTENRKEKNFLEK